MSVEPVENSSRPERKSLDANSYATKKTIAQGLLDVALLTANASQLKYILQVGESHDFYSLMLGLIITSIVLQLLVAILFVIISGLNINKDKNQTSARILNDIILIFIFLISIINIIISGFGMQYSNNPLELLIQLLVCIVLGSKFNINKENHQDTANIANNIILGLNALIVGVNIFISSFEMRENFADNNDNTKSFFNVSTTTETFLKTT